MINTQRWKGERKKERVRERKRKCVGSAYAHLILRLREYACKRLCTRVYWRDGGGERRRERRERERREGEREVRERERREREQ